MNRKEQIETLLETGISKQNIAETFNMSVNEIDEIISSKQVKDDTVFAKKRNRTPRYDEEKFNEGKRLRARGWTDAQIAEHQDFSESFIKKALMNKTYADLKEWREKHRIRSAAYNAARKSKQKAETENKAKEVVDDKTVLEMRTEHVVALDDRAYIELRSIADSLARIAEAAESKNEKRGFFRH